MPAFTEYASMVDNVLSRMVDDLNDNKIGPHQWVYVRGSAFVYVELGEVEMADRTSGYFQAFAPICELPETNKVGFLEEVMRLNHELAGPFFALYKNYVLIKMIRDVTGLDEQEIEHIIRTVGLVGDKLDNPLIRIHATSKINVTMPLIEEMAKVKHPKL